MVFTQHLRVLDCAVLRRTMLMCFTIGRQPHRIIFSTEPAWELFRINFRKIARYYTFVNLYEGALCVSIGHKLPFLLSSPTVVRDGVTGTLRDG